MQLISYIDYSVLSGPVRECVTCIHRDLTTQGAKDSLFIQKAAKLVLLSSLVEPPEDGDTVALDKAHDEL